MGLVPGRANLGGPAGRLNAARNDNVGGGQFNDLMMAIIFIDIRRPADRQTPKAQANSPTPRVLIN